MDMSFAQALNEAKQVIVQQSNRIKTDAEKIKLQQQTIVDQCSLITDHEVKLRSQAVEIARHAEQFEALEVRLAQTTVGREQAEAVIDRQGERLTHQQDQLREFEKQLTEQREEIQSLTAERDSYRVQLPSKEDEEALAAMTTLLTTKKAGATRDGAKDASTPPSIRINADPRAEAA